MYELDKRGLVTSVTNRRGEETTSTFDGARRRTNRTDALGNEIDWTYDDTGNVTEIEDALDWAMKMIDGSQSVLEISTTDVTNEIYKFTKQFKVDTDEQFKFINNGIFGYTAYDAVKYFEDVEISKKEDSLDIQMNVIVVLVSPLIKKPKHLMLKLMQSVKFSIENL